MSILQNGLCSILVYYMILIKEFEVFFEKKNWGEEIQGRRKSVAREKDNKQRGDF